MIRQPRLHEFDPDHVEEESVSGIQVSHMTAVALGFEAPSITTSLGFEETVATSTYRSTEYTIRRSCPGTPDRPASLDDDPVVDARAAAQAARADPTTQTTLTEDN